jgi:hypothetical protein
MPQWHAILLGLILFCFILTLLLIAIAYRTWSGQSSQDSPLGTHMSYRLFLWTPLHHVQLPLITLPIGLVPTPEVQLDSLHLSFSIIGPSLKLKWSKGSFSTPCGPVTLPTSLSLSLVTAYRLTYILRTLHLCRVLCLSSTGVACLHTWLADCSESYTPLPLSVAAPLYPDLPPNSSPPPSAVTVSFA